MLMLPMAIARLMHCSVELSRLSDEIAWLHGAINVDYFTQS